MHLPSFVSGAQRAFDRIPCFFFSQVHSFDLMLELLVVNRTSETLQNVLIELSTQAMGLKRIQVVDILFVTPTAFPTQLQSYAELRQNL